MNIILKERTSSVADPGFPVGGRGLVGKCGPPMRVLFSENVCENKRIGSRRGRARRTPPDPPMLLINTS